VLQALVIHKDSRCDAISRVEAEAVRPRPGTLALRYVVSGAVGDLKLPGAKASARADDLWRSTCFEAFVRPAAGAAYAEVNLAPSTEWAAYWFLGYRAGMSIAHEIGAPAIELRTEADCFTLQAVFTLGPLAGLTGDAPWRVGLSAVIEETNGRKSYWALAHPPGKADFHHSVCFGLELAAPSRA
jgi:hypothetical protein